MHSAQATRRSYDVRSHMPSSLFMPVDRRDLLDILHAQDAIADTAQDIAELFLERDMRLPPDMDAPLKELVAECIIVVEQAHEVIEGLDELLQVGFRGRQADQVQTMLEALNKSEDRTDVLEMVLSKALFAREDELSPVTVILWYRLIEWIGDLADHADHADHAEKVGNRLRLVIAS